MKSHRWAYLFGGLTFIVAGILLSLVGLSPVLSSFALVNKNGNSALLSGFCSAGIKATDGKTNCASASALGTANKEYDLSLAAAIGAFAHLSYMHLFASVLLFSTGLYVCALAIADKDRTDQGNSQSGKTLDDDRKSIKSVKTKMKRMRFKKVR
jgi:uncharacterized membrane protein